MKKSWLLACALAIPACAEKWTIQYFYDQARSELEIQDLAFPSAERGIAVGTITDQGSGHRHYTTLATSDGGKHWALSPVSEEPRSIFFLNDSVGWMVTSKGVWRSEESGKSWKKIGEQVKGDKKLAGAAALLLRVWFLDEQHGFGVGLQKTLVETKDGGKTWTAVEAASKPAGNPAYTAYTHIWFSGKRGVIAGASRPPRPDELSGRAVPDWADPGRASKRRQVPTLMLMGQTVDGGAKWVTSTAPLFGTVSSLKFLGDDALIVLGFGESFEWSAEVDRLREGATGRVFRAKSPRIIDAAMFPGKTFIAGVEPTGKMNSAPIPGAVKVLESSDYKTWNEMKVDYKAEARWVMVAGPDAEHVWIATDTGMILKLEK